MTDVTDLLSAVSSRYAVLDCPSWPDPWPAGEPDVAAYSRLTDPDRYRVLFRRVDCWLAELATLPGVTIEDLPEPGRLSERGRPLARGRSVTSDSPGAGRLLVLEQDDPMPAVTFALGHRWAVLEEQPDCGCDACDHGSQDLLDVVDRVFVELLTSPVVVLRGPDGGWDALWSREWRRAGGHPDIPGTFEDLMDLCERIAAGEAPALPTGTKVWTSQPWLHGEGADRG